MKTGASKKMASLPLYSSWGPRKKACISLFSLGRIGTFQWVTANPNKKNLAVLQLASRVVSKTDQRRKRPVFLDINVSYRASDIRQEKSIGPAHGGRMPRPSLAPVGSCGAATVFQFNRIFDHSYRYSLLLLAASTAIQRPLI
jgi:hypothetical protein